MISTAPPFVLRFSKDERRVFQQNQIWKSDPKIRIHSVTKIPTMKVSNRDPTKKPSHMRSWAACCKSASPTDQIGVTTLEVRF